jgi:hypothetical protein
LAEGGLGLLDAGVDVGVPIEMRDARGLGRLIEAEGVGGAIEALEAEAAGGDESVSQSISKRVLGKRMRKAPIRAAQSRGDAGCG